MTKREMREFAKDKLMQSIAVAYYGLENDGLTKEEEDQVCKYMNQYGKTMGKAIGKEFYTM